MSVRKLKVGMAVVLILGIAALLFVMPVLSQGPALPPGEYDLEAGQYVFNVPELVDTPIAPTDTPVPPTDTPEPNGHDDRAWHPLTEEFGHEHGGNPHLVDDIFGTQFYAWSGGDISYPWETPNENALKHRVYKWFVGRDQNPDWTTTDPLFVKAYRVETHFIAAPVIAEDGELGTTGGFINRFHSYYAEVQICHKADPSDCGITWWSRWADYGAGTVNAGNEQRVLLPSDALDPPVVDEIHGRRLHAPYNPDLEKGGHVVWYENAAYGYPDSTWRHRDINRIALAAQDAWARVDPNDPFRLHLACPDVDTCAFPGENSSARTLNTLVIWLLRYFDDGSGRANFTGWTDRYGRLQDDGVCSAPALDCVPYGAINVPVGIEVRFRGRPAEYDTSPPGESWIRFPN